MLSTPSQDCGVSISTVFVIVVELVGRGECQSKDTMTPSLLLIGCFSKALERGCFYHSLTKGNNRVSHLLGNKINY